MSKVKNFNLTYNALNDKGTVSEGDTLTGIVSFTLKRQTKVKSLFVKAIGDATVHWSEGSGDDSRSYRAFRRYFKAKQYLIGENSKDNVLPQGTHRFRFELEIPHGNMPSSFKTTHGKIIYVLTAKMSRSWRFPCAVQQELNFVSKSTLNSYIQVGSVDKEMGVFSKGQVQMAVTVDRKVYTPGESISVVAEITNSSSKKMRPKFHLQQNVVCYAEGSTNSCTKSICKMAGDTIAPQKKETVSCQMQIPHELTQTIRNCDIISVDYNLKVYLDISLAFDPQVEFPIVITPAGFSNHHLGADVAPCVARAFGGPSNTDFPPPVACAGPYPEHANMHQLPQQTTPYGASYSDFSSSSTAAHWQPPTAPSVVEHKEPPTYTSIFPESNDFLRG